MKKLVYLFVVMNIVLGFSFLMTVSKKNSLITILDKRIEKLDSDLMFSHLNSGKKLSFEFDKKRMDEAKKLLKGGSIVFWHKEMACQSCISEDIHLINKLWEKRKDLNAI